MELKTSIEELKQSLLESEAFVRYQKVRAEVHNYPEKEYRLHEFRRKNYFLQNSREQLDLFTDYSPDGIQDEESMSMSM
mgnify:FL=1